MKKKGSIVADEIIKEMRREQYFKEYIKRKKELEKNREIKGEK